MPDTPRTPYDEDCVSDDVVNATMPDTLSREEIDAIRNRMDVWSDYGPDPTATITKLLTHIDALTARMRDCAYGLRHQPEISREDIAGVLERIAEEPHDA